MKTVNIEHCGDCPHRYYEGNDLYCEETSLKTSENAPIPSWCPLTDAKEVAR